MIIHKSHSKTDLVDLINLLNLKIVFNHSDNKNDIQEKFVIFLKQSNDIVFPKNNYYNIYDITQLKDFLINENPKKILNVKEKNNIMNICKKIIAYCNDDYNLEDSCYDSLKDIIDDMDYIKQFGDISSVRRACKLMNKNPLCDNIFNPLISVSVQKELDSKKTSNKEIIEGIIFNKGEFCIKNLW